MKHLNHLLLSLFLLLVAFGAQAQNRRYFDEVFDNVTVTTNVTYARNATVLFLASQGQAVPVDLKMNVYSPEGDTETDRPLVIILHSGNFLPPTFNGGCTGTINDADNIELATRLAKMGYVAAIADYRLGWNPVATDQTTRVFTLINATYRGVQDSRACIRYFRKDVAENANSYGIDPNKITLWGFGTGGYITLASATLDTITDAYIPKFLTPNGPMVLEVVNGNVDGTTVGITFPGYPGFPAGDTLNYPNHVGYSSDFGLSVNLGGAMGDLSWLEPGETPIMSFHVPNDPFAPCDTGIVNVPQPPLPVVEVMGSCAVQPVANAYGNADVWVNNNFNDPLSVYVRSINGNLEGFFPFNLPADDSSPWAYASSLEPYGVAGSNCDTSVAYAGNYLDSIINYFAPRACAVFGLDADCQLGSSTKNINAAEVGMFASPNPAEASFLLQSNASFAMLHIELVDISGRIVRTYRDVNTSQFEVQRAGLAPGLYFARVTFKEGIATQKVVLK
ncbi:MAG: T9SS type A sorting domain-containing protein [Saprospiraceae bacterium]|nr:T9SS type A sorting domain-containing protein [Saprospiraceae bacterium]